MGTPANRRAYIDWMRGLSVLFMIEAHTFDAWTVLADRTTPLYKAANFVGGLAAPIFLFLAGVSVAMACLVARATVRRPRGGGVVGPEAGLGDLRPRVPLPAAVVDPEPWGHGEGHLQGGHPQHHGAVDCRGRLDLGPALATGARACVAFGLLACAFAFATPVVRNAGWLAWLPDPVEWYIRPFPKLSVFTFFPWSGYVFAGAVAGECLDTVKTPAGEWRANRWLAAAGVALIAAGYGAQLPAVASIPPAIPTSGPRRRRTTSSRSGIMLVLMGAIYVYVQRPFSAEPRNPAWSPMLEFGRSSLFVYWIHVELAYGIFTFPIHRKLPVWGSLAAFLAFTLFIYGVTLAQVAPRRRLEGQRRAASRSRARRMGSSLDPDTEGEQAWLTA